MQIYNEEKVKKAINSLIVVVLFFIAILLFLKVYDNFKKQIDLIISTIFPFIISFIIVYGLMPIINIISVKPTINNLKNEKDKKGFSLIERNEQNKIRLNRNISIALVLVVFFVLLVYIISEIVPLISTQLSSLLNFFMSHRENLQVGADKLLSINNMEIEEMLINSKDIILGVLIVFLQSSIKLVNTAFSFLFMTPIFTILLFFSYDNIVVSIEKSLTNWGLETEKKLLKLIDESLMNYTKVTLLDCVIVGVLSYFAFNIMGIEYSLLFSMIIGVSNVIPFIGPCIGLIPVVMFTATQSFYTSLIAVSFVTILQSIEANITKPYLTSKTMKIHPITTLLVVLIGGSLFGIGGAFLAIPVYTTIKIIVIFYLKDKINLKY